jgi:hypothetical protein
MKAVLRITGSLAAILLGGAGTEAQITLVQKTPAEIGSPMMLEITDATPSSPVYFTGSMGLLDPPVPAGTAGLLYCASPRTTFSLGLTGPGGTKLVSISVPPSAALLGMVFPMQAIDIGALPAMDGSALSNPLAAWFGPHPVSISPAPELSGSYGWSVAFGDFLGSSDVDVAVGAVLETVSGAYGAGKVYVYEGPGFGSFVTLTSPAPQIGGLFGWSLAALDWDGDGDTDLAVGEPGHDGLFPLTDIGVANVFYHPVGSAGVSTYGDPSPVTGETLGISLAAADLDLTPSQELVAGAPWNGGGQPGGVFASLKIFGYAGGSATFDEYFEPNASGGDFGRSVAAGDVDGDGLDEILVGEPNHDEPGASDAGAAHLFDSGVFVDSFLDDAPAFGEKFGSSVAIGDLDGDGLGDLLIGVLLENVAQLYPAPGFPEASPIVLVPAHPGDIHGGRAVAIADVNGDGKLDALLAAGSCSVPGPGVLCGSVTAYLGHALEAAAYVSDSDIIPWSLAAGDVDGDGKAEIGTGYPGAAPMFVSGAGAFLLSE